MSRVTSVINVTKTTRGWEVFSQGEYSSVFNFKRTRDEAIRHARLVANVQLLNNAQMGQEGEIHIYVEKSLLFTQTLNPEFEDLSEPEPELRSEPEPELKSEPEPEPELGSVNFIEPEEIHHENFGLEDYPLLDVYCDNVVWDDGTVRVFIHNHTEEPVSIWRSINGKEGVRKLNPTGDTPTHWVYKGPKDSLLVLKCEDTGQVLYSKIVS